MSHQALYAEYHFRQHGHWRLLKLVEGPAKELDQRLYLQHLPHCLAFGVLLGAILQGSQQSLATVIVWLCPLALRRWMQVRLDCPRFQQSPAPHQSLQQKQKL